MRGTAGALLNNYFLLSKRSRVIYAHPMIFYGKSVSKYTLYTLGIL